MTESPLSESQSQRDSAPPTKRRKVTSKKLDTGKTADPVDAFQQVTLKPFVDEYRVRDMGFGGDVYYQPDVCLSSYWMNKDYY